VRHNRIDPCCSECLDVIKYVVCVYVCLVCVCVMSEIPYVVRVHSTF